MLFRRSSRDKPSSDAPPPKPGAAAETLVKAAAGPVSAAPPAPAAADGAPKPLAASDLRRTVDPQALGFKTTADLEPAVGLIGQDRAVAAIRFGVDIKAHDFNIFVAGPPASGKSTAVTAYISKKAGEAPTPSDWVYVTDFEDANRPKAIPLPPRRARLFAKAMNEAIDEVRETLPAAFEADDYQARRRSIEEEYRADTEGTLDNLISRAESQNVAILKTPMGFAMAPMHDGKVVKPDVFSQLPARMRDDVKARIETLEGELATILSRGPKAEKSRRRKLAALAEETAKVVIEAALDDHKAAFTDLAAVSAHLDAVGTDLVRNVGIFLEARRDAAVPVSAPLEVARDPRLRRYRVNVFIDQGGGDGAPIIEEQNPTYATVLGRIDHLAENGVLVTDFLLLKAGALHRANGGYLLIDAKKLLQSPFAWDALKRAIKTRGLRLEPPTDGVGLVPTQTLEPQTIPLDVKVILFGDRETYEVLSRFDPDFPGIFKVQADFDDAVPRSPENDRAYARLVAAIIAEHKLKPCDSGAVSRVIEEAGRLVEDRDKLSIEVGRIADIVREADHWAGVAKRATTTREDVARAIEAHVQRSDRLRDKSAEAFDRKLVLVDVDGDKVGRINGLSVIQHGRFAFGHPSRITARARMGAGRVTDIEREVELGGALHSKGVMILWGYLAGHYARDVPLALAATLVFEQSYGSVDGDSASAAELFALLSALSEATIRQGFGVTGSINQWGEMQPIGGVNQKIEGFYDVCKARGLTGRQGVVIPRANAQHLMLREDVVEAAAAGRFAIHAISTVDEGLRILTGLEAGERGADGEFPKGSVNRMVEDRLRSYAERSRAFAGAKPDNAAGGS